MTRPIELLAPVGNILSLKAAINSGADAVYMGGKFFNARMSAENFTDELLDEAVSLAAISNVKIYITMNTLIKNQEFKQAVSYAKHLEDIGASGIILQDIGLSKYLSSELSIPLHASTQAGVHNLDGVLQYKELGFDRVILSRETSLNSISHITKNTDMEIETFIHGALCSSFSGNCLCSSIIGGRSGNRGKCAQPCRLKYNAVSKDGTQKTDHMLSTKDLSSIAFIKEIINAGVSTLKIEGRLKRPEYVAVVCSTYRKVIDAIQENNNLDITDLQKQLLKIYNRGGFTTGYYFDKHNIFDSKTCNHNGELVGRVTAVNNNKIFANTHAAIHTYDGLSFGNKGIGMEISDLYEGTKRVKVGKGDISFSSILKDVVSGDEIYRTTDSEQITAAKKIIEKPTLKKPITGRFVCKTDKPITLELTFNNTNICVNTDVCPQIAKTKGITIDDIKKSLNKTGDTYFEFKDIEVVLDDNSWLPLKAINDIRRVGLDRLLSQIILDNRPKRKNILQTSTSADLLINQKIGYFSHVNDITSKDFFDANLLQPKVFNKQDIISAINSKTIDGIVLPTITMEDDMDFLKDLFSSLEHCIVVCNNIGQIHLCKQYKNITIYGGRGLNVFNDYSIDALKNLGVRLVCSSLELNLNEINQLKNSTACQVFGDVPLMQFFACPNKIAVGCEKCKTTVLESPKHDAYRFNCNTIINTTATMISNKPLEFYETKRFKKDTSLVFNFCNSKNIPDTIRKYESAIKGDTIKNKNTFHYFLGVE